MKTIGQRTRKLLNYIESSNTHGRNKLLVVMAKLDLKDSNLYRYIDTEAPTSIGKNQLKDKMLQLMVAKLK